MDHQNITRRNFFKNAALGVVSIAGFPNIKPLTLTVAEGRRVIEVAAI